MSLENYIPSIDMSMVLYILSLKGCDLVPGNMSSLFTRVRARGSDGRFKKNK